jgi:hypothetical protein
MVRGLSFCVSRIMGCGTKIPSSCRITSESCDCCTCNSTPIAQNICEPCSCSSHHSPHRHEGCSCVHPVIICACVSCTAIEKEGACHGHHAPQSITELMGEKKD